MDCDVDAMEWSKQSLKKKVNGGGLDSRTEHDPSNLRLHFEEDEESGQLRPRVTVVDLHAFSAGYDAKFADGVNHRGDKRPQDIKMVDPPTEAETVKAFGLCLKQAVAFRMISRTLLMEKTKVGTDYVLPLCMNSKSMFISHVVGENKTAQNGNLRTSRHGQKRSHACSHMVRFPIRHCRLHRYCIVHVAGSSDDAQEVHSRKQHLLFLRNQLQINKK